MNDVIKYVAFEKPVNIETLPQNVFIDISKWTSKVIRLKGDTHNITSYILSLDEANDISPENAQIIKEMTENTVHIIIKDPQYTKTLPILKQAPPQEEQIPKQTPPQEEQIPKQAPPQEKQAKPHQSTPPGVFFKFWDDLQLEDLEIIRSNLFSGMFSANVSLWNSRVVFLRGDPKTLSEIGCDDISLSRKSCVKISQEEAGDRKLN
eukprot:TRINITY_DN5984_c0_g1_i1.p1 TRINITY_DN5984_c0_g1~~TRINITY_DN5984_c0_g1_i1.p1  ORF type:complete len:218 (-),score=55.70 TRINITY_DN5984_c0_g1_i1:105-725(-)